MRSEVGLVGMSLRRSVTVALLAWAVAQHASAMNYVVIGPDMMGDVYSLDFDSVKRDGKLVSYTTRTTLLHDPRFHVPANWDHEISTTLANCDDKTSAMSVFRVYDSSDAELINRITPGDRLQFARYADDMDRLLLALACKRVEANEPRSSLQAKSLPATDKPVIGRDDHRPSDGPGVSFSKFTDGSEVASDRSGKGAVMCMWGIYVAMLAIGDKCSFEEDVAFTDELRSSIKQINAFIAENSHRHPITKAQVGVETEKLLKQYESAPGICRGDLTPMYGYLRQQGPVALKASTKALLSVPREPVTNPCL